MSPSPGLLQRLSRSRLLADSAAISGIGERRSTQKGSGMEFADHREYQHGDDIRHLDPHLYARLGEHFIKQYMVYKQLPTTILVDGSASMAHGTPAKFEFARTLAGALAYVGLVSGDPVMLGVATGGKIAWSPRVSGTQRAPVLFTWLDAQAAGGAGSFADAMRAAPARLAKGGGLLFLISDWWVDNPDAAIRVLGGLKQEMIGIQVVSREEVEPQRLGTGEVRLVDAESGYEVELALEPGTLSRYANAFAAWRGELRSAFARQRGRFFEVVSDDDAERLLLRDWRVAGLVG